MLSHSVIFAGLTKGEHITASCAPNDVQCVESFKVSAPKAARRRESVLRSRSPRVIAFFQTDVVFYLNNNIDERTTPVDRGPAGRAVHSYIVLLSGKSNETVTYR